MGMIKTHIEASQYMGLNIKSTKEIWDTLTTRQKGIHTGLSTFYMKVGILEKKYSDGDDMHEHLNLLMMENHKLSKKGFYNEFLVQVMLMSLPWECT
jgi:hypothetical protein